jgi:hypothetical protein
MAGRTKGRGQNSPPTLFDENRLQANATEKAGEAMMPIMQGFIKDNFGRPISTLSKSDIEWLAVAAITGWIHARAEQAKEYGGDVGELIRMIE